MSEKELYLWCVHDGEENHFVGAHSAFDAMRVCAENWGDDTWDEYLAEPGVQVTKLSEKGAKHYECDGESLWRQWEDRRCRGLIGWTE